MTSDGSAYARFRRALPTGNLVMVRVAAAEIGQVDLVDALAVMCLIEAHDPPERFEAAAVRWAGRLALERRGLRLDE